MTGANPTSAFPALTATRPLVAALGHFLMGMTQANEGEHRASACTPADQVDIDATLAGDHDAYARLVRRYQQHVGNYLWRFTHDTNDHEDLVHTTFIEAFVSLPKFRGEGTFRGWLLTIATRVGYAYWKQQARTRKRNDVSLDQATEPAINIEGQAENPDVELLAKSLAQLSPRDRLVLTLLYLEEHDVAETAKLTGWSKSMVKVQAHRARGRLKKLMRANDDETA